MEMTGLKTTQVFLTMQMSMSIYVDRVCVGAHLFVIQNLLHA